MGLKSSLHNLKEKYRGTKMAPAFGALHTFLYTPNDTTHGGTHIKAADDLKRTMNTVILALIPCLIFGMFNAGYQHNLAFGDIERVSEFFSASFWTLDNFTIGFWKIIFCDFFQFSRQNFIIFVELLAVQYLFNILLANRFVY